MKVADPEVASEPPCAILMNSLLLIRRVSVMYFGEHIRY